MVTIEELTAKLNRALKLQSQIEVLQQKLDAIVGGSSAPKKKPSKRTMSPATLAKMRAAQQARWARLKASPTKKAAPAKASIKMVAKKKVGCRRNNGRRLQRRWKARWAAKKTGSAV